RNQDWVLEGNHLLPMYYPVEGITELGVSRTGQKHCDPRHQTARLPTQVLVTPRPRSAALFDGLPWGFMETDRPLPPATCQKVNGPECGNECQNRKYLMNGQYF